MVDKGKDRFMGLDIKYEGFAVLVPPSHFAAMDRNASLLIAAAFTMIGFALGRVTAPPPPPAGGMHVDSLGSEWMGEDVQVIVTKLEDGFEGDTAFTIPGGQVMVVERDGQMEVEVNMEETSENVWVEEGEDGAEVVVRKRVVVTGGERP